ncbi:hypothetical protein REPUB_Repub20aG0133200 [Reevesia pubescens]
MGVFTHEMEFASPLPPAKAFKAFVLDFDNLFPKVVPQSTFSEGSPVKRVKGNVEILEKEKFFYSYTVIEGNVLMNKFEKICHEIKFEASPSGGSTGKRTSKYYTIGDCTINEEEIKAGIDAQVRVFKAIEDYLLANPHY